MSAADVVAELRGIVERLETALADNSTPAQRSVRDRAEADAALADGKLEHRGYLLDNINESTFAVFASDYTVPVGYEAPTPEPERVPTGAERYFSSRMAEAEYREAYDAARTDLAPEPDDYKPNGLRVSPATWHPPDLPTTERVDVLDALRDGRTIDGRVLVSIQCGTTDIWAQSAGAEVVADIADDGTVEVDRIQPPVPPTTERVNVLDALRDERTIDGSPIDTIGPGHACIIANDHNGDPLATVAADDTVEVDRVTT